MQTEIQTLNLQIHPLTEEMYRNLTSLVGWNETHLQQGQAVKEHAHTFNAMYFVQGVKELLSDEKVFPLPQTAAVFVAEGTKHAWNNIQEGLEEAVVGYFHHSGMHNIVPAYISSH